MDCRNGFPCLDCIFPSALNGTPFSIPRSFSSNLISSAAESDYTYRSQQDSVFNSLELLEQFDFIGSGISRYIPMLLGHADRFSEISGSNHKLLDHESPLDEDGSTDSSENILYMASFEELARNHIKYDTIIWLSISLLLVLAWGVGVLMLLYLPVRRYILKKDISSRKLYVTPTQIVYKVSRPSFIPFRGTMRIEKHVPLERLIDIVIEQGCLQSIYEIHTFRIESISRGKTSPVDELQVQGVSDPAMLRKIIIREASKVIQEVQSWKPAAAAPGEGEAPHFLKSPSLKSPSLKSPSRSLKMAASPRYTSMDRRTVVPGEMLLNKLDEVSKSVKKLEFLIERSQGGSGTENS